MVSTTGELVGRSLFVKERRGEIGTLRRVVHILELLDGPGALDGRTLLDVGANIGTTTVTALCSHPFARAVSCEPAPDNARLLRVNVAMNDLEPAVTVLTVAVSDVEGTTQMLVSSRNSGANAVAAGVPEEFRQRDDLETVEVETMTLDAVVRDANLELEALGLLWMDVQGHEGHALAGASTIVERGVPVLMEFHPGLLSASGGMEPLERALHTGYTHFLDIGDHRWEQQLDDIPWRPVVALGEAASALADGERRFTDILAVRLRT